MVTKSITQKLYNYYRSADKYADRLDSHNEKQYGEYVSFVKKNCDGKTNFLDIGCGTGLSSYLLAQQGYRVTGMDISSLFIERAKKKCCKNLRFLTADTLRIPFKDNVFDYVACFLVIEHLSDIPTALREMIRITKPKGRIIILSPNLLSPFNILLPLISLSLGKKDKLLFGIDKPSRIIALLIKNTWLLFKKITSSKCTFIYREPVLENRFDFTPDNDAAYYACPIDFKRYFKKNKSARLLHYQGVGRMGKIVPSLATGIHIVAEKTG